MEEVIATSLPLVDVLWAREAADTVLSTPERRAGLDVRLRQAVKAIQDPILRKHYGEEMASRLRDSIAAFRAMALEAAAAANPRPAQPPQAPLPSPLRTPPARRIDPPIPDPTPKPVPRPPMPIDPLESLRQAEEDFAGNPSDANLARLVHLQKAVTEAEVDPERNEAPQDEPAGPRF